jgi:gamma-glutamylcyclotransferase (GGCT)/AIG2-like uncharacterized protein YtfP
MSEYLFAYGTLQPGFAPDDVAPLVRTLDIIGKGTVQGTLYNLGSYPGAVIDPASPQRISGTVFRLPEDSGIMRKLDTYEGYNPESPHTSLFIRRVHPVHMTNGQVLECWIYEYNGRPDHASIIESGTYTR